MDKVNLIWCHRSLTEVCWLKFLLSALPIAEVVSRDFGVVSDNSIYVIGCNANLARSVPPHFFERLRHSRGKGLIHLSDERYGGGYQAYGEFDFVIRNYHSTKFDVPGVVTIPLGYTPAVEGAISGGPASRRRFLWSFLGNMNGARSSMVRHFNRLEPRFRYTYDVHFGTSAVKMAPEQYVDVLANSAFCPCPMGNVNLETYRVYEALEMGCIPLVEQRLTMPYFARLMPGNPIPAFFSWASASRFVERLQGSPAELDRLQQTVSQWWQSYKSSLALAVRDFCLAGQQGAFASELRQHWRRAPLAGEQVWRISELVRHHNVAAAVHRLHVISHRLAARIQ